METAHMPAPLHLLAAKPLPCGCGRTWSCIEPYTTLSGLPYLLAEKIVKYPKHPLARSSADIKEKILSLRSLAQKKDPLAVEIFDFQARAMGLHVANLVMALDPGIVVIGGGLMDPEATSAEFRERYLRIVRETARPYLWPAQRKRIKIVPAVLGDLSQAIGAALVALHQRSGLILRAATTFWRLWARGGKPGRLNNSSTFAINCSGSKGLKRNSLAPASSPANRPNWPCMPVSMMIGTDAVAGSCFKLSQMSKPFKPGNIRSSTIKSGDTERVFKRASMPLAAVPMAKPAAFKVERITSN